MRIELEGKILMKHTGLLHITRTLSLGAQKLYNILVYLAQPHLSEDKLFYQVSINDLRKTMSDTNQNNDYIVKLLHELKDTSVNYNIFGKVKGSTNAMGWMPLIADLGFIKDINDLMKHIPSKRQTLFFSATITKKIKELAYSVVRNAIRIQISPKNPVAKNIIHAVVFVEMDDKRFFLENVLKEYEGSKFVVFVRTKVRAERVVAAMERVQVKSEFLHGGLDQKERFAILDRFRSGENMVLITTDVAARGIDIPDVEYVINYDLPDVAENYVHRVGRTGRGNKKGQALAFCSTEEIPFLEEIEVYTGEAIERYELDKGEYMDILKDTEDGNYNWQKLIKDANKEDGKEEEW